MTGCIYRTKDGECDLYAEGGKYTAFCEMENCEGRKMSNADKIRSMTDEELADLYMRAIDDGEYPAYWGFKTGLLIWLKSPADKDGDENV